jgi:hypothetical protein
LGRQTRQEEVQNGKYDESKGLAGYFDIFGNAVFVPKD